MIKVDMLSPWAPEYQRRMNVQDIWKVTITHSKEKTKEIDLAFLSLFPSFFFAVTVKKIY